MGEIQNFTDLVAWQKGHKLVLSVYRLTDSFPPTERFALANQMTRAVVSITSNIAEGFSRQGNREKIQFYYLALGSVTEVQNQLLIARDLGYITAKDHLQVTELTVEVHKLINGLIKSIKSA